MRKKRKRKERPIDEKSPQRRWHTTCLVEKNMMSHLKIRRKDLFGNWKALLCHPKDMTPPIRVSNCIDWKNYILKIKRPNYSPCVFRFTIKAKVEFHYILERKRSKYPLSAFLFYFLKLKIIKSFNYLKWFKKTYIPREIIK